MKFAKKSKAIIKAGSSAIEPKSSVAIGGMNEKLVVERRGVLEEMTSQVEQELEVKAQNIIKAAEARALNIVKSAEDQAASVQEAAHNKGYEAGLAQAKAECEAEIQAVLSETGSILKAIEQERDEALHDEEERIYRLITIIANKILEKDLEISKEACISFINKAIRELEHKAEINLIVGPSIASRLNELKPKLVAEHPELQQLNISTDSNFGNGDLVLESNKDRLDHRLQSKLDLLLEEILKA